MFQEESKSAGTKQSEQVTTAASVLSTLLKAVSQKGIDIYWPAILESFDLHPMPVLRYVSSTEKAYQLKRVDQARAMSMDSKQQEKAEESRLKRFVSLVAGNLPYDIINNETQFSAVCFFHKSTKESIQVNPQPGHSFERAYSPK